MTAYDLGLKLLNQGSGIDLQVRVLHPDGGSGSAGVKGVNLGNWGDFMAVWLTLGPYQTTSEVERCHCGGKGCPCCDGAGGFSNFPGK